MRGAFFYFFHKRLGITAQTQAISMICAQISWKPSQQIIAAGFTPLFCARCHCTKTPGSKNFMYTVFCGLFIKRTSYSHFRWPYEVCFSVFWDSRIRTPTSVPPGLTQYTNSHCELAAPVAIRFLSLRGAKRRGNPLRIRNTLGDCHVGLRPPRNDSKSVRAASAPADKPRHCEGVRIKTLPCAGR